MIRMNVNIAGHEVTFEGTANEVMRDLEILRERLRSPAALDPGVDTAKKETRSLTTREEDKATPTNKSPVGTHDDQPDLPLGGGDANDGASAASTDTEEQAGDTKAEVVPAVSVPQYKIEDLRKAIQAASRESKQAAKKYLEKECGKADLNKLPTEKYGELMGVVTEGDNETVVGGES